MENGLPEALGLAWKARSTAPGSIHYRPLRSTLGPAGCTADPMLSVLPSFVILGLAALAALVLALSRPSPPEREMERHAASHALALAVGVQSVHFAEETATGFHERFPALFGLPAMPLSVFVAAWFLAIAGMLNGLCHDPTGHLAPISPTVGRQARGDTINSNTGVSRTLLPSGWDVAPEGPGRSPLRRKSSATGTHR